MDQEMSKDQIRELLSSLFQEQMPFHHLLGITVSKLTKDQVELKVKMKPQLVGNVMHGILHGGVTATMLDAIGGMVVFNQMLENMEYVSQQAVIDKLQNLGTIDLRVDYLRPGRGEEFTATATIIRAGNKVAVARMELHNEKGDHIAFGTGTYMVG